LSKKRKASEAQRRILENLVAGRPTLSHLEGRSQHGGASGTMGSLMRNGWITRNASSNWVITDAGCAAIGIDVPAKPEYPAGYMQGRGAA